MSNNKMGLITMCRKAGKLEMGMDMVKDACRNGYAKGVFAATDFSSKSLKEIKYVCYNENVPLYSLGLTMDEIWRELGKKVGVMAITDNGFYKSCIKGLEQIEINSDEFYSDI